MQDISSRDFMKSIFKIIDINNMFENYINACLGMQYMWVSSIVFSEL